MNILQRGTEIKIKIRKTKLRKIKLPLLNNKLNNHKEIMHREVSLLFKIAEPEPLDQRAISADQEEMCKGLIPLSEEDIMLEEL